MLGRLFNVLIALAGVWCALIFLMTDFMSRSGGDKAFLAVVALLPFVVVLILHYIFRSDA